LLSASCLLPPASCYYLADTGDIGGATQWFKGFLFVLVVARAIDPVMQAAAFASQPGKQRKTGKQRPARRGERTAAQWAGVWQGLQ
jgi:hypothetical protein